MAYRVIRRFYDLNDSACEYNVGDSYPRTGLVVSDSRIKELSGNKNRLKTPLIVEEKKRGRKKGA